MRYNDKSIANLFDIQLLYHLDCQNNLPYMNILHFCSILCIHCFAPHR